MECHKGVERCSHEYSMSCSSTLYHSRPMLTAEVGGWALLWKSPFFFQWCGKTGSQKDERFMCFAFLTFFTWLNSEFISDFYRHLTVFCSYWWNQEHRLEKEKHLEDYNRDHPSSTTTKTTTTVSNTSTPESEGDKGSGEGTSNTDAKENTEPSTEPGEHSTPIEEPEADKTMKSAPWSNLIYVTCRYFSSCENLL